MTESTAAKLAEKLGFRVEMRGFCKLIVRQESSERPASDEEIALWNLCLELSERVKELERSKEVKSLSEIQREGVWGQRAEKEKKA